MSNETDLDWLARSVHVWPEQVTRVYSISLGKFCDFFPTGTKVITKQQWLARRAALQNKPSWKDAPEWAEWLAQDEDGEWKWLAGLPGKYVDGWTAVKIKGCCEGMALGDWHDTLEKRPEDFKPFTSIEDNQEQDMAQQQEMKQDNGWFERGELPPIGTVCEHKSARGANYSKVFIVGHGELLGVKVAFYAHSHDNENFTCSSVEYFRPIRTERDVLIDVIKQWDGLVQTDDVLADAILAAGFSRRDK